MPYELTEAEYEAHAAEHEAVEAEIEDILAARFADPACAVETLLELLTHRILHTDELLHLQMIADKINEAMMERAALTILFREAKGRC